MKGIDTEILKEWLEKRGWQDFQVVDGQLWGYQETGGVIPVQVPKNLIHEFYLKHLSHLPQYTVLPCRYGGNITQCSISPRNDIYGGLNIYDGPLLSLSLNMSDAIALNLAKQSRVVFHLAFCEEGFYRSAQIVEGVALFRNLLYQTFPAELIDRGCAQRNPFDFATDGFGETEFIYDHIPGTSASSLARYTNTPVFTL